MTESPRLPRGRSLAGAVVRPPARCAAMALAAAVLLGGPAQADLIELSDAGVAALRENHWLEPQAHASGKGWFVQGQIIVLRDEADQPTLPNPGRYFMFRPLRGPFTPTGPEGKPQPDAKEVRLEFAWTHGMHQDIDTLDDIRGLISNRDLRYRNGAEALEALLADIDPEGLLHLKKSSPPVADDKIVAREGWLSNFLIIGPASAEARAAETQRVRAMPHEDPLGYNPIDPRQWLADGATTMGWLLQTLAHCAKWGEPEPGLQASCFAVAHFICDSLYVVPSDVPVGARENANRVAKFQGDARRALLSSVQIGSPVWLSQPPRPGAKFPGVRPITQPDDAQPVDLLDEARAALEVLDTCRTPPDRRQEIQAVDTLVHCAAGRADFLAAGTRRPLPPEFTATVDGLGRRAFEVLQHFVTVPPAGTPDTGAAFRLELRSWLSDFDDAASTHAAREALARAGLGDDAEIAPLLDYLFSQALHAGADRNDERENVIFVLKRLPGFIADAARRGRFQAEVDQRLKQYDESVKSGYAGSTTKQFLDQYAAAP